MDNFTHMENDVTTTESKARPDVFRLNYKELSDGQKEASVEVKIKAQELWNLMDDALAEPGTDARLIATAKTLLEETIAIAVKGITA